MADNVPNLCNKMFIQREILRKLRDAVIDMGQRKRAVDLRLVSFVLGELLLSLDQTRAELSNWKHNPAFWDKKDAELLEEINSLDYACL